MAWNYNHWRRSHSAWGWILHSVQLIVLNKEENWSACIRTCTHMETILGIVKDNRRFKWCRNKPEITKDFIQSIDKKPEKRHDAAPINTSKINQPSKVWILEESSLQKCVHVCCSKSQSLWQLMASLRNKTQPLNRNYTRLIKGSSSSLPSVPNGT